MSTASSSKKILNSDDDIAAKNENVNVKTSSSQLQVKIKENDKEIVPKTDSSSSVANRLRKKIFSQASDVKQMIRTQCDKGIYAHTEKSETTVYDDGTNSYFWRAHTVSVLVVGISVLVYVTFYETQNEDDLEYNVKRGLVAGIYTFLAFGVTQVKDSPFIRPHPALWRLVLCMTLLYELGAVFLLFQTAADARKLLVFLDKDLNKPLDFTSYNNNCTIYDPGHPDGAFHNVYDKMDIFVIAHLVGWFWKAIIFRDVWITNVISFIFELLEYTFQYQLPNFFECWWDHWILDFVLCNGTGIYCGLKFIKYLSIKQYQWQGVWRIHSYKGKMKRVVGQFTPYSWVKFKWMPTQNLYKWLFVSMLILMSLLAEMNTFYLKFVLWIPSDHPFVFLRLVLYTLCAFVAVREAYDFASEKANTFGQYAWVLCAVIMTELMIVCKFGWETLCTPFPAHIKLFWLCVLVLYISWSLWKFQMRFPIFRKWSKGVLLGLRTSLLMSSEKSSADTIDDSSSSEF